MIKKLCLTILLLFFTINVFADTDLLVCHFDGADEATTTTDSTGRHTLTNNGTVQLDTAIKKWGTASSLHDGNSDYWTSVDSADWNNNSGEKTIACWFRSTNVGGYNEIVSQYYNNNNHWRLYGNGSVIQFESYTGGGNKVSLASAGGTLIVNTWHWVVFYADWSSTERSIYVDGQQVAWASTANVVGDVDGVLQIGATAGLGRWMVGNIDDLIIVSGNPYGCNPNVGKTDTIDVPTGPYSGEAGGRPVIIVNMM